MKNQSPRFDLFNAEHLFQIRAEPLFDRLRSVNAQIQQMEAEESAAVEVFYTQLPEGYSTAPYSMGSDGKPTFALLDPTGNDVAFPLNAFEAHCRAWRDVGQPAPEFSDDPRVMHASSQLVQLRAEAVRISFEMNSVHATAKTDFSSLFVAEPVLA